MNKLVVPGTEFFRDASVWRKLRSVFEEECGEEKCKVLISGLTNGTELYSLIVLLREINLLEKVEIHASSALFECQEDVEDLCFDKKMMEISVNNYNHFNPKGDLLNYFVKNEDSWCYRSDLIKKVANYINYQELDSLQPESYDIVWSRNQMIYWKGSEKSNYFSKLDAILKKDGIIGIGVKEQLPKIFVNSYEEYEQGYRIFKKI